ncbi:MAG: DUF892 family protein [Sphingomonas sp.]
MAETTTDDALLTLCVQDLHAGCRAVEQRLPHLVEHATATALLDVLAGLVGNAGTRAARLEASGCASGGPENIWMKGIMDDAERDTGSIAGGRLLDVAMVGAVRKAIAAELVSIDTALAMARRLDRPATHEALQVNHADLAAADETLVAVLAQLTG